MALLRPLGLVVEFLLRVLLIIILVAAPRPSCAAGKNVPGQPYCSHGGLRLRLRASATTTAALRVWDGAVGQQPRSGLLRAIPALQRRRRRQSPSLDDDKEATTTSSSSTTRFGADDRGKNNPLDATRQVVSVKTKAIQKRLVKLATTSADQTGFYYGVSPRLVQSHTTPNSGTSSSSSSKTATTTTKPLAMKQAVSMTLDELRSMRLEMQELRDEIRALKRNMLGDEEAEEVLMDPEALLAQRRKRQREFDRIGREVERWAEHLLFEQDGEVDGWKEIACNKVLKASINADGRTRAYLKWMKDSRGSHANPDDDREYPCIKVFSTIDAPLEIVCQYLSDARKINEYNDLMMQHKDLEEVAPHAKITWGQTPPILFIQPRDFITFCHHRWLRDGTQVVVNQACDSHEGFSLENPQAYALRGANFLSRHPDDPEKTRIALLAHANPGPDIPHWASKTAVKALVPIEPFKLFCKINKGVAEHRQDLEQALPDKAEMVSEQRRRSTRPAGIAQMGYACFWPQGGGLQEESMSSASGAPSSSLLDQSNDDSNHSLEDRENMNDHGEDNGSL